LTSPLIRTSGQEALFEKVAAEFAAPLARLARAHEADAHQQQDLLQEIHIALWRSLAGFGERCSLRTWVYRVAHNVAATHVLRNRRRQVHRLTTLDEIDLAGETPDVDAELDAGRALQKIHALIQALKPLDRQRDARRGGGRWVPLFFIPGHVMYFVSLFAEITPIPWKAIIFNAAEIGFGTRMAIVMTDRRARRLQQEIDALDSL
jgi:RNA polymerase sigma-70 factor (ECF subfamily)